MITHDRDHVPTARVSRVVPLDAARAWPLVADARHHTRWVPLTRVGLDVPHPRTASVSGEQRADDAQPQVGDVVMAVTGPGARQGWPGLVDRMRIERYEPPLGAVPGVAVFVKLGPVILGTARIEVEPAGPGAARVTWSESVHLRGMRPAATAWAGAAVVDLMVTLVLRRVARDAARLAARTARTAPPDPDASGTLPIAAATTTSAATAPGMTTADSTAQRITA